VDREEGGREKLESAGVSVITLSTARQIMSALEKRGDRRP